MNEFSISLNGTQVKLYLSDNGTANVNGIEYHYEIIPLYHSDYILKLNNRIFIIHHTILTAENYQVKVNGKLYDLIVRTALQERAAKLIEKSSCKSSKTEIKAPMPGMILKINKAIDETVTQGESLLILEAMKMENELRSPVQGKIMNIFVEEGSTVEKGALLFTIE